MSVRLVFLGRLEDVAGVGAREVGAASSLAEVISTLEPELAAALSGDRVRLAVNGTLMAQRDGLVLKDGDDSLSFRR